jgi:hypothetical protein
MNIEWTQVLVAFILGVLFSASVKGFAGNLRGKAGV